MFPKITDNNNNHREYPFELPNTEFLLNKLTVAEESYQTIPTGRHLERFFTSLREINS